MSAPGGAARSTLPEVYRRTVGRATIGDQLRRHARTQPAKPALIAYGTDGGRRECTYRELDERANAFAHALLARGVRRGDRVACLARNSVEVVVAYYGALKVGAAFTGINVLYRGPEVLGQLRHAEPAVVVAGAEFAGLIEELRPELRGIAAFVALGEHDPAPGWESWGAVLAASPATEPDVDVDEHDLAMLVYTSGTEAEPKGVMIPHRNYLISTAPAWSWGLHTGPDDIWLFVMPLHTIAGLGSMTTLTLMGATLVLPDSAEPARCLEIIDREQVTVIAQTPTFYLALCQQPAFGPASVGAVRRCMTYGGQVSPHTIDAWAGAAPGAVWGTYWGQSELSQLGSVGWFRTLADIPDGDPSWIGKPVTHLEIRVVDADGHDAEIGELLCRTPSVMLGYFKDPERTEAVFDGEWVRTGDVVRVDACGNLFFHDRAKDVIKSGGMNVSSQVVERVLHAHPDVARAAVVGMPDDYWSEAVTAFVIARTGASIDPAAVIGFCRDQLAVYKAPKAVHVVDEFPLDSQGKILKRQLRDRRPDR
ncbi:MAG: AMP-binding protein [Pseudonocardiaceae bacterium]|nr:AMP-binding protein [Pseudonocardiaceae bacterium]